MSLEIKFPNFLRFISLVLGRACKLTRITLTSVTSSLFVFNLFLYFILSFKFVDEILKCELLSSTFAWYFLVYSTMWS